MLGPFFYVLTLFGERGIWPSVLFGASFIANLTQCTFLDIKLVALSPIGSGAHHWREGFVAMAFFAGRHFIYLEL